MAIGPILIVDDDTVSRHVLCQALAQAGLRYEAVGSGSEALEAVARLKPAVMVLAWWILLFWMETAPVVVSVLLIEVVPEPLVWTKLGPE